MYGATMEKQIETLRQLANRDEKAFALLQKIKRDPRCKRVLTDVNAWEDLRATSQYNEYVIQSGLSRENIKKLVYGVPF